MKMKKLTFKRKSVYLKEKLNRKFEGQICYYDTNSILKIKEHKI